MNVNLVAAGAYWPLSVVSRKGSSLRVCNHDEDAITLSVEAGMAALGVSGTPPEKLDGLYLALGGSPLAEGPMEQIVSTSLGLRKTIATASFFGSELASLAALFSAEDALKSGRLSKVLVIASEGGGSPRGELPGSAAVALMLSRDGDETIATIELVQRKGEVAFHRWRENLGEASSVSDNRFLKQYYVEQATQVLGVLRKDMQEPPLYGMFTGAPGAAVQEVLKNVFGKTTSLHHSVDPGDFGVAGPFLGLLTGLGIVQSGQLFLVVSHGSGQTVAMSLLAEKGKDNRVKLPAKEARAVPGGGEVQNPKLSLPAMSPFFWRGAEELLRLDAHRCVKCGLVVFPPSLRPICRRCHSSDWETYRLPRKGRVYTYCVNNYTPVGFPKQVIHILADLEDGTRYWAPASEMRPEEVTIGTPVQLVLRRFTQDEGALVYGMKFVNAR